MAGGGFIAGRELAAVLLPDIPARLAGLLLALVLAAGSLGLDSARGAGLRRSLVAPSILLSLGIAASDVARAAEGDERERAEAARVLAPDDVVIGLSSDGLTLDLESRSVSSTRRSTRPATPSRASASPPSSSPRTRSAGCVDTGRTSSAACVRSRRSRASEREKGRFAFTGSPRDVPINKCKPSPCRWPAAIEPLRGPMRR